MKYSKVIKVNDQFKNSINIEYDLTKDDRINKYIPTEDVCEVLNYYFNSVEDNRYNRSTILEGPYGKGKSYLILALLQLLMLDAENKNVSIFLNNLKNVDQRLYKQYLRIKENGTKLLPVIINSNYTNLTQAFNKALKEALERVSLEEIFPNTAYDISLSVIQQWKKKSNKDRDIINKCLNKQGLTLNLLENRIKDYDPIYFEKFVDLYNCIVNGLSFNPFASDDVVKNYSDISYKINKYGYSGIFVVFDEFSKFIESDNKNITSDLKLLQDLAEMVNRSGKIGQMHLCCITHKSLSNYYKNKKETVANAFRTVEGRFKEIRFNRSMNQNYRIISLALKKNNSFEKVFTEIYKNNISFYNEICSSDLFKEVDNNILIQGCFPLNPLTTFVVVNIAELIAQNERTLFTFISDNDTNSLSTFINDNENGLFNVDKIYDYFSSTLAKSEDEYIRRISNKAQVCLTKTSNNLAKRAVKVLALIKIINIEYLSPNLKMISLCLNESESSVSKALNDLLSAKLLKKSSYTEMYDFALANSRIIDLKVELYLSSKAKLNNLSSVLNTLFDNEFVLPRKFNARYKMTRFYREKYISDFELIKLNSFETYLEEEFCDGIIFNVIRTDISINEIKNHFKKIHKHETIILCIPNIRLDKDIVEGIFRIDALKSLLADKNLDETVKEEARLIAEDETGELNNALKTIYSQDNAELISDISCKNKAELVSNIMEDVFYKTPIINNEMINKEQGVSTQYVKHRNNVVNLYLNKQIKPETTILEAYSATSPENTIFKSIKDKTSVAKRSALDEIKTYLKNSEEARRNSTEILDILKNKPYGIRSGVLPLLFAMAIDELDDNVLFYKENKEIDLNAENINRMIESPNQYSFSLEVGSEVRTKYLYSLMEIFGISTSNDYRRDVKLAVYNIQKWIMSLPRIIRCQSTKNNFLQLDDKFIKLKNIFMESIINDHEIIFKKIPSIFEYNYQNTLDEIEYYKNNILSFVNLYSQKIIENIKDLFSSSSNCSLYSAIEDWIIESSANDRVLDNREREFINLFKTADYDDISLMNNFSKIIIGIKIVDWENDNSEEVLLFIKTISKGIYSKKEISDIIENRNVVNSSFNINELSDMGYLLKNNIENTLYEFGDSVSNEEKIAILTNMINKIL